MRPCPRRDPIDGLDFEKRMNATRVAAALYFAGSLGLNVECLDVSAVTRMNHSSASSHLRQAASTAPSAKADEYSDLAERVHRHVNELRRAHALKPLTLDPMISAQATGHSAEMARSGKIISHRGFNQRLEAIRKKIPYRAAAENVAAAIGYEDSARTVVEGWKNSPEHRKNMLGHFSLTGIGIAQSKNGRYFLTQIFIEPMLPSPRTRVSPLERQAARQNLPAPLSSITDAPI